MEGKSIWINDVIIDSGYITTIDFHAIILPSDGCKHQSGEGDGDDDGLKIIKCTGCGIEVFEDEIGGGWRGDLWFCVSCCRDNNAPEKGLNDESNR